MRQRNKLSWLLLALGLLWGSQAWAQADFTWTGSAGTAWNNAGNWTLTAGSDADGIPDADDNVVFTGSPANNCVLTADAACKNLTFVADYTATLSLATFNLEVYGDWIDETPLSVFQPNTGTVILRDGGAGPYVMNISSSYADYFYTLVFDKGSSSMDIGSAFAGIRMVSNELIMESGTLIAQGAGALPVANLRVRTASSAFSAPSGRYIEVQGTTTVESGDFTLVGIAQLRMQGNYMQTGGFIVGNQVAVAGFAPVQFTGSANSIISGSAVAIRSAVNVNKSGGAQVILGAGITSPAIEIGTSASPKSLFVQDGSLRIETGQPLVVRGDIVLPGAGFINAFNGSSIIRLSGSWNSLGCTAANPLLTNANSSVQFIEGGNVEIRPSTSTRFDEVIIQKSSGNTVTLYDNPLVIDRLLNILPGCGLVVTNVTNNVYASVNKPGANPGGINTDRTYDIPAADIDVKDLVIENNGFIDLYTNEPVGSSTIALFLRGNLVDNNTAYPSNTAGFYVGPSNVCGNNNGKCDDATSQPDNNALPTVVLLGNLNQTLNGNTQGLKNINNSPIAGLAGIYLPNVYVYKASNANFVEIPSGKGVRVQGDMYILTGTFRLPEATMLFGNRDNDVLRVYGVLEFQAGSRLGMCTGKTNRGSFLQIGNGGLVSFLGTPSKRVQVDRDGTPGQYYRMEAWPGGRVEAAFTNFNYQCSTDAGFLHDGGANSDGGFKMHYGSELAPPTAGVTDDYDYDNDGNTTETGPRYQLVNGEPIYYNFSYCSFAQGATGNTALTINTGQTMTIKGARFTGSNSDLTNDNNIVASTAASAAAFGYVGITCLSPAQTGDVCGVIKMVASSGTIGGSNGEGWDGGDNDDSDPNDDRIIWSEFAPVYWVGGMVDSSSPYNPCDPSSYRADPDRKEGNNNYNEGVNQGCDNSAPFDPTNWADYRNWSFVNDEFYNPLRIYPGMPKSAFSAPELRATDFQAYIIAGLRPDELAAIDTDGDGDYMEHFDTDNDGDVADNTNIVTDARIPDDIFERFNVYLAHTAPNDVVVPATIVGVNGVGNLEIEGNLVINGQNMGTGGQEPQDLSPQNTNAPNTQLTLQGNIAFSVKKSIIIEKMIGSGGSPALLEAQGNAQIFVGQNYMVSGTGTNDFGNAASVVTFTLNGPGEQEVKYNDGDNWEDFVVDKPSGGVILQGGGANLDCFEFRMEQPNGTATCRLSTNSDLTTRDDFILNGGTFIFDNGEVRVGGSWLNNGGFVDETILNAAAAVRFRPTTPGNYTIRTRGQVFYRVFFDNAGGGTSTYTIEDGMRALAQTTIGNNYVVQTATVPIGTIVPLHLTGLTVRAGGTIDLNPGAELLMQTDATKITPEGSKNLIINGILEAIGTQDQYVRISRMGNDYYRFDINGRAAVRFYNIQFTDENGVDMRDGTPDSPGITLFGGGCPVVAVGTFSDGTFTNGKDVNNATYLWLPSSYESQDVFNVNFPLALTSPGASNVRRDNANGSNTYVNTVATDDPPVGVIPGDTADVRYQKTRFINATGVFAGESYDRETGGSWTGPADSIIVWSGKIKHWDGGGDGTSWHDPLNWTDDALPTIEDAIVIDHRYVAATINITADGAFLPDNYTPTVDSFAVAANGTPEIACRDLIIDTGGGNPINLDIIHSGGGQIEAIIQRSSPCPDGTEYGGDLTASQGVTIRTGNGFQAFTIGKGWSVAGTFDYDLEDDGIDRARVVFNQNVGSRTITTGPTFSHFWDVEFQGGYSENNDMLFVDNDFWINKTGVFTPVFDASDVAGIKIYVGGDWINNNGLFVPRSGEVVFNGSGPQTITRNSSAGLLQAYENFYDLRIEKPTDAGTVTLNNRVVVENLLTLNRGIFVTTEDDGSGNGKEIIIGQLGSWVRSTSASPNTAFVDGPVGRIFQGSSVLSTRLNFPIGRSGYAYTGGNSPAGSDGYALQVRLTNNNPTAFTMQIMEGMHPEDEDEDGTHEPGGDDGNDHDITKYASGINMVTTQRYWKIKNIGFPTALPLDAAPAVAAGDLAEAIVTLRFDASQNTLAAPPPLDVQYPNVMADLSLVGQLSILQDFSDDDLPYLRQATPVVVNTELPIRRGYASKGEFWRDIGGIGDLQSNNVTISSTEPLSTLGNSRFTYGWYFIPLPVEVLSLQAKVVNQSQVQLDWVVANESRLAYYGVERSTDGQQFVEIARIEARNGGETVAAYYHIDPAPHQGVNYYRLRQEEKDGKVSYSKVVAVEVKGEVQQDGRLSVYPNPNSGDEVFVVLPFGGVKSATVRLYDMTGRLVQLKQLTDGTQTLRLQFAQKPQAGVYLLSVQNAQGQMYYSRLVIE
ncbi:MAG: hypothetical protein KatS3mg033_2249 [Thermonema sp.]|uniref:T9SS type A sorting domain-containing protein n=1 Tax=Thermonema sp. TaxID=2231181 RepID=UPI0021DE0181|nr:T9SS type A sorting domain-containing protein [Thermonema sp.]GIV40449.1 MAG: hypothetical protein KatS3mg033_2249 [Thermonema sp.]